MAPVFSLVLDEDITEDIAFRYPELYQNLQKVRFLDRPQLIFLNLLSYNMQGRELSLKQFFVWVWQSVYQGGTIMLLSIFLFENSLVNIVAITFTALILAQLLNVAFEIHTWNRFILASEIVAFVTYFASMFLLTTYFGTISPSST